MALHNDLLKITYVSNVTLCDNHIHLDLNLKLIFSHLKLCVAVPDFHTVGFKKKGNTASKKIYNPAQGYIGLKPVVLICWCLFSISKYMYFRALYPSHIHPRNRTRSTRTWEVRHQPWDNASVQWWPSVDRRWATIEPTPIAPHNTLFIEAGHVIWRRRQGSGSTGLHREVLVWRSRGKLSGFYF